MSKFKSRLRAIADRLEASGFYKVHQDEPTEFCPNSMGLDKFREAE